MASVAEPFAPGMPVEIGQIDRELKKLWEASSGAATRASLINLAVYSEAAGSLEKNTQIIARIAARGRVNTLLGGLRLSGDGLPRPGSPILGDEKRIGRVTTAVHSPALGAPIALAFLRREWTEPGRSVAVEIEGSRVPAETCALPFVPVRAEP